MYCELNAFVTAPRIAVWNQNYGVPSSERGLYRLFLGFRLCDFRTGFDRFWGFEVYFRIPRV